ncbi:MAG: lysophospholipid acyltransferase family protein [Woeseiaceae bacterium]|nr:lysophospholipid acyltransferase family protein [Woeseiaceae bacterium]
MLNWIRSLVFQVWFFGSVVLFASAAVLVGIFPGASFRVARAWCRGMLLAGKVLCGLDYVIEGRDNIPDQPSVILIKHSSVWEAYAQVVIFPRQCWVLKRELFSVPFFGWGLRTLKPIAIDRGAGRTAVRQVIDQGKSRLAEGIWVTVFPEGTRVAPGTTKKYGISGAALAHEAGVPVVPVAHNAGDYWPRRSLLKRPGLIRVCIGPPLDGAAQSPKETNALVQSWIETKMTEISSGYQKQGADDSSSAPADDSKNPS